MTNLIEAKHTTLPTLIDRAATALASAKSSAEVLEARDTARLAYDMAKSAGRMARAKEAHDEVIAAVYRAQADALLIEARAKIKLADEYDAAQERGEVASGSTGRGDKIVGDDNDIKPATAADLGLRRDEIHEARKLRDAEAAEPGMVERTLGEMVERGEEPTKAKLKREITPEQEPSAPRVDPAEAKMRRELKAMTTDGLIQEVIGLRAAVDEHKAGERAAQEDLKRAEAVIKEMSSADDKNRSIALLDRQLKAATGRINEHLATIKKMEFRLKKVEAERDKLRAEVEGQLIPL